MRYERPQISDQIIERSVDLWCRALARPKFDNGATELPSILAGGLASMNAEHDRQKVDNYDAAIERFREALVADLKLNRDNEGQPMSPEHAAQYLAGHPHMASYYKDGSSPTYRLETYLTVDYNPCLTLARAAEAAGLPASAFSWKSSVSIRDDHVSTSFGYGAADENHYPLPDGRWLITRLRGEDMPLIIHAVTEGRLPEMTVEEIEKVAA